MYEASDVYGWVFFAFVIGGIMGMIITGWMLSKEPKAPLRVVPQLQLKCRHPFAVCPCNARFFLEFRSLELAPDVCPSCGRMKELFGVQEFEYLNDVWFPVVVEAKAKEKCSKVKSLKSESCKPVVS